MLGRLKFDPVQPRLTEAFEVHQRARRRVDNLLDEKKQ